MESGKNELSKMSGHRFLEEQNFLVEFDKTIEYQYDLKSKMIFLMESIVNEDYLVDNGVLKVNVILESMNDKVAYFTTSVQQGFKSKHKVDQEIEDYEKTMKHFNLKNKNLNVNG